MSSVPDNRCGRPRRDGQPCRNPSRLGVACWRHTQSDLDSDFAAMTKESLADLAAKRAPIDWTSLDAAWGSDDDD